MRALFQMIGVTLFGIGLAMTGYTWKTVPFWLISIGLILWIEGKEDR